MKRTNKRFLGIVAWLIAVICGVVGGASMFPASHRHDGARRLVTSISRYVTQRPSTIRQIDPVSRLRPGDPVFLADDSGGFHQAGAVSELLESAYTPGGRVLSITWYDADVPAHECQLFQYHSSGRLSEVVATLMPPEKQQRIRELMAAAMARHGEELSRAFAPLVEDSFRRSLPVIEDEFRLAVARHRSEFDQAAQRWNDELVQQRLIPMARREILPIVQKHGRPPAEEIGREIWDRASLFRFGWRAIYDKTPLPRKDLVREEWNRFVEEDAVPILEQHMDEIVVAIQRSVRDIAANKAVRNELAEVAEEIASDPQSRRLINTILKETFVENDRLREVWRDVWNSAEARSAFDVAGDRLEPVVRKIGDEIFGSEQDGINPDFARVLRSQILRKDRRWIVAWHTGAGSGTIEIAKDLMPYPIVYVASEP